MKIKTNDGATLTLSEDEAGHEMFKRGLDDGRNGRGQEGGFYEKNGPAYRVGWWVAMSEKKGSSGSLPFTAAQVRDALKPEEGASPSMRPMTMPIGQDDPRRERLQAPARQPRRK